MALSVGDGDITTPAVDAVANAANDRREREAVAEGPIAVGDAVATGAGRLPARWVVEQALVERR